jgi:hypothetical protein
MNMEKTPSTNCPPTALKNFPTLGSYLIECQKKNAIYFEGLANTTVCPAETSNIPKLPILRSETKEDIDTLHARFDDSACKIIYNEQLLGVTPRLSIVEEHRNIEIHASSTFFYAAQDFAKKDHGWWHSVPPTCAVTSAVPIFILSQSSSYKPDPSVCVLRSDDAIYKKHFGNIPFMPGKLAKFVTKYGHSNMKRDGGVEETDPSRLEMSIVSAGQIRPFGFEVFDLANDAEAKEAQALLASIFDAQQDALDELCVANWGIPLLYNRICLPL